MKKKILFILENLGGGGAEKILVDILKRLDKDRYDIDVFLIYRGGRYIEKVEKQIGKKVKYLMKERKDKINNIIYRKLKSIFILLKNKFLLANPTYIPALLNKKYDIEIAFLEGRPTEIVAKRRNKAKKLAWVHIDLKKHRGLSEKSERKAYKYIEKIICVSNDSKNSLQELYPEYKEKIEVIYNPIDRYEILNKADMKSNCFLSSKLNLITVGRLSKQKGYDILLKAHNELLNEGLDYNLYILGEGSERKNLENYIAKNKIENNTFLLGFKENPYPYIKEADIFISSSRYEGYPLVVCEALCLGKPIIATKCTGPTELLDNGKYGLLAEVEDVESLKNKMRELILSKEKRREYSKLSKNRSKEFNSNVIIKQIENILE